MKHKPTLNIGMIGHVANGKSSLVRQITGTETQRHSSEKKKDLTIKLGYANAKIWRCSDCPKPQCYQHSSSSIYSLNCRHCNEPTILVKHVSFVDCPGHNSLMATMLNGSFVMDTTILVVAANNRIPAPQTAEHLLAAEILGLNNELVCVNKIDLVKKNECIEAIVKTKKFLKKTPYRKTPIVPISANLDINVDVVCELIANINEPDNKDNAFKMIVIRSFNINKQNVSVKDLKGGVIGGSIKQGILSIGDKVVIVPGYINGFTCIPLVATVQSINSEKNDLEIADPGGLLGVQLDIAPGLAAKDRLAGQIVYHYEEGQTFNIFRNIRCLIEFFKEEKLTKDQSVIINHNGANIQAKVKQVKKKRVEFQLLDRPIHADPDNLVTVSTKISGSGLSIIGRAKIVEGDQC